MNKDNLRFIIDEGNSLVKFAAYKGDDCVFLEHSSELSHDFLNNVLKKYEVNHLQKKPKAIYSSTRVKDVQKEQILFYFFDFLSFDSSIPIPIINLYKTPKSLGTDRLAAVVGASVIFPNSNVLVIDIGTCITFDFIDCDKQYFGGGIMPGLKMKLQALHTFTKQLPLVNVKVTDKILGNTTEEAIQVGVVDTTILGLDAIIQRFKQDFYDLKVILCGGDSIILQDKLKNDTFAEPKLVLYGLKKILDFNEYI